MFHTNWLMEAEAFTSTHVDGWRAGRIYIYLLRGSNKSRREIDSTQDWDNILLSSHSLASYLYNK